MSFISFSNHIVLARASSITLSESGESSHSYLVPNFRKKAFGLSPLGTVLAVRFLLMIFIVLRKFSSTHSLLRAFIVKTWHWAFFHFPVGHLYALFWKNVCSGPLPVFKIGLFVFLQLNCFNCLYILNSNDLSDISFASIFPDCVNCLFILLVVYFSVQKFLSVMYSHLSILGFVAIFFLCQYSYRIVNFIDFFK